MTKRGTTEHRKTAPGPPPRNVALAFAGLAALATLVFFASFVTDREAMLFGSDMLSQAYQSRAFAVQEVEAGRGLPHWNPYVYGGLPYLSILPYPVWYPTSLLYFAIPLWRAIGWAFVLHFLLAGVLAYGLARELDLAPGAAAVTGAAYMFTGYLVSHLHAGQDGRMFAMTWTPALFLLAERAIDRRRIHWFGWLALVVVLQLFTPHVQMMYFAALAVGAYVVFRLVRMGRSEGAWRTPVVLGAAFAGAYLLAGLVALVEIWPTLNMVRFSHRAARGYEYASSWAMPVQETLGAIWPSFQGTLQSYWGTNPFKLHTEYLGAVPVLLAALALAARRTPRVWFFAALAAAGLLFAWGGATPIHRLLYWTLPMMKQFRAPGMMFSVVALAVVVLAGYGAQALYDRRDALARKDHVAWKALGSLGAAWVVAWFWVASSPDGFVSFWGGLLYGGLEAERAARARAAMPDFVRGLGVFTLAWWAGLAIAWGTARRALAPLVACALLAVITVADLWRVDRWFYDTLPAARLTEPDPAMRYLQGRPGPFRLLPLPTAYGPNDPMLFRIAVPTGSQNFRLSWWDDLVGEGMERLGDPRILELLNVRYVASGRAIEAAGLELVHRDGGPLIYQLPGEPRGAWVVHEARARPEDTEPAAALLEPGFDPFRVALLEPGTTPPPLDRAAAGSRITWIERNPDRLVLEVDTPGAGLLVLSEVHHPYWSAAVDGDPAEVLRVDVALRGVPVPAGTHEVVLDFHDPYVRYGAAGSLIGLVLLIGGLGATWRRRHAAEAD